MERQTSPAFTEEELILYLEKYASARTAMFRRYDLGDHGDKADPRQFSIDFRWRRFRERFEEYQSIPAEVRKKLSSNEQMEREYIGGMRERNLQNEIIPELKGGKKE